MFDFIQKWGYLGLFIGSLIEGESVVLTISSMAYFGKFYLPKVMFIAFLGTVLADQFSFHIGKYLGKEVLNKHPKLTKHSKKVFALLAKYDVPFILGFRFIYGIRIVSPFLIGLSHISVLKFTLLNILSAVIWSVLSCTLGYYVGAFSNVIGKDFGMIVLVFNILIMLAIIVIFHFVARFLARRHDID